MLIGARCCLVLTAWVAWLALRRARSRAAVDSMSKRVWCGAPCCILVSLAFLSLSLVARKMSGCVDILVVVDNAKLRVAKEGATDCTEAS
jgi:hypothetical protein